VVADDVVLFALGRAIEELEARTFADDAAGGLSPAVSAVVVLPAADSANVAKTVSTLLTPTVGADVFMLAFDLDR